MDGLAYAYSQAAGRAVFKQSPADFIVQESLSFEPEGEGNQAFLYIEKTNTNTEWLARQLARFAGIELKEVGYAGLKDRQAVSSQWFSVKLEGVAIPDWDEFLLDGVRILKKTWHRKKLKRGAIKNNQFKITLRDIKGISAQELQQRVEQIAQQGVPNYFGRQRFGHDYNNLQRAARWFNRDIKIKKRIEKSMVLSAARSMVFNQMLSERINQLGWNTLSEGEVMMLNGSRSVFAAQTIEPDIQQRFTEGDIHPTMALWGRGRLSSTADVLSLEQNSADKLSHWCQALENQGLQQARRTARLVPGNISITIDKAQHSPLISRAVLCFSLPSGCYATAVLRELVRVEQP